MHIEFEKMVAAGNDFIVIDNSDDHLTPLASQIARAMCDRHFGVGSDGLLLFERSDVGDFRMRFINPDGSSGMMCGNGGRCIARFAHERKGMGRKMRFEAAGRLYGANILDNGVELILPMPSILRSDCVLESTQGKVHGTLVDSGAPHFVIELESLETPLDKLDVNSFGREIRSHDAFSPDGTNVDFVQRRSATDVYIRTYERGVEGETLACGTGAVAATLALFVTKRVQCPLQLHTRSNAVLSVDFVKDNNEHYAALRGDAKFVFRGALEFDEQNKSINNYF